MRATLEGQLVLVPETSGDVDLVEALKVALTMPNPAYQSALDAGASTRGIPSTVVFYEEHGKSIAMPRAVLSLPEFSTVSTSRWTVEDRRVQGDRTFRLPERWRPREHQEESVGALEDALDTAPHFGAILQAPGGTGKTVMAMELIRRIGKPTCVLVHKGFLMEQWLERAKEHLPDAKVGFWRLESVPSGNDCDIVVAMIQSLMARVYPQEVYDSFGLVISDEVHRLGAPEWHRVISRFPAARRAGLTATPHRRDGLAKVFLASIGPVCHVMPRSNVVPRLAVVRLQTAVEASKYVLPWNRKVNMGRLVTALAEDEERNARIVSDVVKAAKAGRKVLVLTGRLKHVTVLVTALSASGVDVERFVGGMGATEQTVALEAQVIVATYPMAREGLDVPELDTLVLATPQSDVEQPVYRIMREHPLKKEPLVVDYVDRRVGPCAAMFRTRSQIYARLGLNT